jgi:hypothetical protein
LVISQFNLPFIFQNIFFYEEIRPGGNWQFFTALNTEYNFGEEISFANKLLLFVPVVFMSYFPLDLSTVLGFVQHAQRFGDFTQDLTDLGFGGKHQLIALLNLEVLCSKLVRGINTGPGQRFNIGLTVLF